MVDSQFAENEENSWHRHQCLVKKSLKTRKLGLTSMCMTKNTDSTILIYYLQEVTYFPFDLKKAIFESFLDSTSQVLYNP